VVGTTRLAHLEDCAAAPGRVLPAELGAAIDRIHSQGRGGPRLNTLEE